MITVLIFLAVISVLVFVHEFGHFIVAKRAGMRVDEFAFGFPPTLYKVKRGETTYAINAIPFGGYVKIYGENGEHRDAPRSFGSASLRVRLAVIVAGVAMNLLFAVPLLMAGNFLGLRIGLFDESMIQAAREKKIQIVSVSSDSPAQQAGLLSMDEIVGYRADGKLNTLATPEEVQAFANENAGTTVTLAIRRGNEERDIPLMLRAQPPAGQGPIGISLALTGVISYPWYVALWRGIVDAGILFVNTVIGYAVLIASLFKGGAMLSEVSGPIGIATLTGQAARVGFNYLIQFVAMISVNLAVLNLLPFPALDGGRVLMLAIEKIKGSPIRQRTEGLVNGIGFALLITLMIAVTIKDIGTFF